MSLPDYFSDFSRTQVHYTPVQRSILDRLANISALIEKLDRKVDRIVTTQGSFDADLSSLITAINGLEAAYTSLASKAANAGVDLSAEDAQVESALASIDAALNPPAATPAPAPAAPTWAAPAPEPVQAPADSTVDTGSANPPA